MNYGQTRKLALLAEEQRKQDSEKPPEGTNQETNIARNEHPHPKRLTLPTPFT